MALCRFLRQGSPTGTASAEKLGCQAATLGLETLCIAGIHERALKTVTPPQDDSGNIRQDMIERAETFFTEAIVPIEATHGAARKADAEFEHLSRTLQRRDADLSASSDQLKQATARREAAETGAGEREAQYGELLAEAQRMQKSLRHRMHGILSQQEGDRKRIGDELRDEIAQALLAIDLSLLALNTAGQVHVGKIGKSIADAQRILLQSTANWAGSGDRRGSL